MSRPVGERKSKKPHHMHALDKGAAVHLFRGGHIDQETHDEIVKHAERGMAKARKAREEE